MKAIKNDIVVNDIMVRALLKFKLNGVDKVFYPEEVSRPSGRYYAHYVPMTRKGCAPSYVWKWNPIQMKYTHHMQSLLYTHEPFNMSILILAPSATIVENWNLKQCRYLDNDGSLMTITFKDAIRGEENIQYLGADEYLDYVK